jgi:predicted transport protein
MSLFKFLNNKLLPVKEKKISLEKDIQSLTENNLEDIFGYTFVSTEIKIDSFRFDTLAWDDENNSFVIIEYKKDRNFSVVDQGFAYLSVLLNRKADFILEYNSKFPNKQLNKEDIDWSQSRVIFIAPYFTPYQINSINFRNMPFDLYEFSMYENDTVAYNKIEASNPTESIDSVVSGGDIEKVTKEVKDYSVEDHFKEGWEDSRELFNIIDERLLAIDPNIMRDPKKVYIGYKIGSAVIFSIEIHKTSLCLQLYRFKPENFSDPEKKVTYQKNSFKYYNKHVSLFRIEIEEDIDYAIMLAKQVYKKFIENN